MTRTRIARLLLAHDPDVLGPAIGVTAQTISNWQSRGTLPRRPLLPRIAEVTGIDETQLREAYRLDLLEREDAARLSGRGHG